MTPLGTLCRREPFPAIMDMMHCLIEVDSSAAVIENGIICCLKKLSTSYDLGSIGHDTYELKDTLLKANPEVAKWKDQIVVHGVCRYIKGGDLLRNLIDFFLTINKDALKITTSIRLLLVKVAYPYITQQSITI